jgi:hypothetical protein
VSRAFPSYTKSIWPEICLCHPCSCHVNRAKLRVEMPGQASGGPQLLPACHPASALPGQASSGAATFPRREHAVVGLPARGERCLARACRERRHRRLGIQ